MLPILVFFPYTLYPFLMFIVRKLEKVPQGYLQVFKSNLFIYLLN